MVESDLEKLTKHVDYHIEIYPYGEEFFAKLGHLALDDGLTI